jgi:hypothetical protein
MERKEFDEAVDEFAEAVALDARDPLTHFYLALWKYREARLSGAETKGLANMIQDLHIVLDWNHEFAEAHNMLAMAQLEGGGLRAATDSMHAALQLSPRNESYRLNMARIYLASKNWDAGTALLEHFTASPDAKIASAARQELQDIPYLKKYGIPPVHGESAAKTSTATAAKASPTAPPKAAKEAPPEEANDENSDQPPAPPPIDRRPIQYAKGKLVAVDCSKAPVAILTVAVGSKSLKLRTQDYHTLALVGVDQFSCSWTNQSVSVNYKAGTGAEGDLVSLEVQ